MKNSKRHIAVIMTISFLLTSCGINNESESVYEEAEVELSSIVEDMEEITTLETVTVETSLDEQSEPAQDGDYIIFGHYEQDGDESNGPEPIEWEIIRIEDNRMLLVSRCILDCRPYNSEWTEVTWAACSLRAWLNTDFINTAFDNVEQEQILTVINSNSDNVYYGIEEDDDIEDKVFCLSIAEIFDNYEFEEWDAETQSGISQALIAEPTRYAIEQGAYVYSDCGLWWLRSRGVNYGVACSVSTGGLAGSISVDNVDNDSIGVRPAIYLSVQE